MPFSDTLKQTLLDTYKYHLDNIKEGILDAVKKGDTKFCYPISDTLYDQHAFWQALKLADFDGVDYIYDKYSKELEFTIDFK